MFTLQHQIYLKYFEPVDGFPRDLHENICDTSSRTVCILMTDHIFKVKFTMNKYFLDQILQLFTTRTAWFGPVGPFRSVPVNLLHIW